MSHSGGPTGRADRESLCGDFASPAEQRAGSIGDDRSAFSFEHAAAQLHASNRRRADLFKHPVMADDVMAVMLTALIADEQNTPLTRTMVAMANRLDAKEAERIIGDLVDARLLEMRAGDRVGLTSLGTDQMRDYVRRMRETAIRSE